ncbi:MAG: hypothetical protein MUC65_09585 [Pontiellaceae bacterium]|nr:hypothetical protein [Pontiellaceae bacterium]
MERKKASVREQFLKFYLLCTANVKTEDRKASCFSGIGAKSANQTGPAMAVLTKFSKTRQILGGKHRYEQENGYH